jgi:hypothetical protein
MSGQGTRYPNGFKDSTGTKITTDGLTDVVQTSAAADADHTKIAADIAALTAEVNKLNAMFRKLLG